VTRRPVWLPATRVAGAGLGEAIVNAGVWSHSAGRAFSRDENASWRVCPGPGPGLRSGDPGRGPCLGERRRVGIPIRSAHGDPMCAVSPGASARRSARVTEGDYHLPGEHWRITSGYWSILRSSLRLSQRWVAGVSACEPRLIRMSRRSRPRIIGVCSDNRRLSVCVEHRHMVGWSQLFVSAACGCRCARCSSRKRCAEPSRRAQGRRRF